MMIIMPSLRATVFLLMVYLVSLGSDAQPTYVVHDCLNTTTYTPAYLANLRLLLSSLILSSNATVGDGFYNATSGRSPDMVYGFFLCRGDVSDGVCRDCVETASKGILERCPKERVATLWYDECMLRYSDQYIFSIMQEDPTIYLNNTKNINISELSRFNQVLAETMNGLATRATSGQSRKKFATKEANFTRFQTLYSLLQCTPDISATVCNRCLRGAIAALPSCCGGMQGVRVLMPSCNLRYELYPFYRIEAPSLIPLPPPSPPPPPPPANRTTTPGIGKEQNSSRTIVAIVVPIVITVLVFSALCCYLLSKKGKEKKKAKEKIDDVNKITAVHHLQYDLDTIRGATNNFSHDNKIGQGGFGYVYKGTLSDGQEIAVKRLSQNSGQGAEEFKNEVVLVAKLQHRNLVKLLGFCLEGAEKILIYEFIPNKSLDYFLFDPEKRQSLDWSKRHKIIRGIARGILYLHEDSRLKIIHRDLKASNILLDGEMNPRISDFGIARIFGVDQTRENTRKIVGTSGYMSPEYAMHGQLSVKSDVYSFGVLLLEIVSGKKNSCFHQSHSRGEDLLSYTWRHWKEGTASELIDPILSESCSKNEVMRCIHIGLLCVQDVADRPTMSSIVPMLHSSSITLRLPSQPAFFVDSRMDSSMHIAEYESQKTELDQSTSKSIPLSVNEMSITQLDPR